MMDALRSEKANIGLRRRIGTALVIMPAMAKAISAAAIIGLALATAWLVYATGGIRYSWSHLIYVPVVLGGFAFGIWGGILAGIVGGLALGPLMPINTFTGEMQTFLNWVYRLIFLCINGALVGALSQLFRRYLYKLQWLHDHHEDTDLLNLSGLTLALGEMIRRTPDERRLIVSVIQLNGLLDIQNTFGSEFGARLLHQIVDRTKQIVPPESLLALIQNDRLAIVVDSDESHQSTLDRMREIFNESYVVDGVPIHVKASIGLAHFPEHARTAEDLLQQASVAMHWADLRKSSSSISNLADYIVGTLDEIAKGANSSVNAQANPKYAGIQQFNTWLASPLGKQYQETFRVTYDAAANDWNYDRRANQVVSVADVASTGDEFELTYNPMKNWRIAFNASKAIAVRTNSGVDLQTFVNSLTPVYKGAAGQLIEADNGTLFTDAVLTGVVVPCWPSPRRTAGPRRNSAAGTGAGSPTIRSRIISGMAV